MVYQEKMVVVIKCQGKIMREQNGEVHLPFGSDYSILIKNKESRKAVLNVEIDGQDVLNRKQLVIDGNRETELQGFLEGYRAKNGFRFIQKTKEIQDYRGDKIDDGLIRVSFRFEKQVVNAPVVHYDHYHYPYWDYLPWVRRCDKWPGQQQLFSSTGISNCCTVQTSSTVYSHGMIADASPRQDEGITVKGAEVNQGFSDGYTRELEDQEHVIILLLKGYTGEQVLVKEPVTVQIKKPCSSCGRKSEYGAKFCAHDGTALI